MNKAAQLAVELVEKGGDTAAAGIDKVTASAKHMGDTVDTASKQADDGAGRLDRAAESSDNLASKSSQATGGLGALAAGFELVGLGPYAEGLNQAAMATDFFSGVGDLANLVLESQAVLTAKAKVQSIASTVATKAQTVATKASTIAQKAMNLAMRANPIGLIITGVILLAGAFVLAYKRSATFRAIVDKTLGAAKAGVAKVVDAFQKLGPIVGKVASFIGKVISLYVGVYVKAFQLSLEVARRVFDTLRDVVERVAGAIGDKIGNMKDRLSDAWSTIRSKAVAAFKAIIAPVQNIIDKVQDLIDKIKGIHLPDVGGIFGKITGSGSGAGMDLSGSGSGGSTVRNVQNNDFSITVTGTATSAQAQDMMTAIDNRLRQLGRAPVFS